MMTKPKKHKRRRGRISVFNTKLLAEQARDVNPVGAIVPFFVVARGDANCLWGNRREDFNALCQLLHRGKRIAVAIRDGTFDGAVHQIAVQNTENIRRVPNVRDVFHDALVIAVRVCPMRICNRVQDEFVEIILNCSFDYNH